MKRCPACNTEFPESARFCPMDGAELGFEGKTSEARRVGGRFLIDRIMRTGSTGELYSALDQQTMEPAVLKIVRDGVFPTPLALERATLELRALGRMQSPFVARILDHGREEDGRLYVAVPQLKADPLDKVVRRDGPFAIPRARELLLRIGEALAEAQKLGVLHKDLSPGNVLVGPGPSGPDHPWLLNFSVPAPLGEGAFGDPGFIPPEQAEGRTVDQRSSVYSLGALAYLMLVGTSPLGRGSTAADARRISTSPLSPPTLSRPELGASVDRIVMRAMDKAPGRRYSTLRQMLSDVDALSLEVTSKLMMPEAGQAVAEVPTEQARKSEVPAEVAKRAEAPSQPLEPLEPELDAARDVEVVEERPLDAAPDLARDPAATLLGAAAVGAPGMAAGDPAATHRGHAVTTASPGHPDPDAPAVATARGFSALEAAPEPPAASTLLGKTLLGRTAEPAESAPVELALQAEASPEAAGEEAPPEDADKVAARHQQEARWFQGDSAASSTSLTAVVPSAAPLDTTGEQRLPGMKPSVWPGARMTVPELLEEMNDGRRYRLWLSLGAAATLVYTVVYLVVR